MQNIKEYTEMRKKSLKEALAGNNLQAVIIQLEKEIDRFFPYEHITEPSVAEILPSFIGEQDQIAPLFSAKSVDGVRAYELARKLYKESAAAGTSAEEFDKAAEELIRVSRINITELELVEFVPGSGEVGKSPASLPAPAVTSCTSSGSDISKASARINVTDNSSLGLPRAAVRIACSKGTYVRAFARDLGEALGSGAHLDSLQRSASGIFRVETALTVEQAIALLQMKNL